MFLKKYSASDFKACHELSPAIPGCNPNGAKYSGAGHEGGPHSNPICLSLTIQWLLQAFYDRFFLDRNFRAWAASGDDLRAKSRSLSMGKAGACLDQMAVLSVPCQVPVTFTFLNLFRGAITADEAV